MPPNDDKIRVSARIQKDLYDSVLKIDDNFTRALVAALTAFIKSKEKNCQTDYDTVKTNYDKTQTDLIVGQLDIMTAQVEFLKRQIEIKDSQLDKQAYSLQSLIQVNSALNMKLLPENTLTPKEEPALTVKEKEPLLQRSQPNMQAEQEIITLGAIIQDENQHFSEVENFCSEVEHQHAQKEEPLREPKEEPAPKKRASRRKPREQETCLEPIRKVE